MTTSLRDIISYADAATDDVVTNCGIRSVAAVEYLKLLLLLYMSVPGMNAQKKRVLLTYLEAYGTQGLIQHAQENECLQDLPLLAPVTVVTPAYVEKAREARSGIFERMPRRGEANGLACRPFIVTPSGSIKWHIDKLEPSDTIVKRGWRSGRFIHPFLADPKDKFQVRAAGEISFVYRDLHSTDSTMPFLVFANNCSGHYLPTNINSRQLSRALLPLISGTSAFLLTICRDGACIYGPGDREAIYS